MNLTSRNALPQIVSRVRSQPWRGLVQPLVLQILTACLFFSAVYWMSLSLVACAIPLLLLGVFGIRGDRRAWLLAWAGVPALGHTKLLGELGELAGRVV